MSNMDIQQRLVKFVTRANWMLFCIVSMVGLLTASQDFANGIIIGGLIVTINFYLLGRTLKKAFLQSAKASIGIILTKYYIRFIITGFVIFAVLAANIVDPVGLIIGLSVVVLSITLATIVEVKKLFFKEAI